MLFLSEADVLDLFPMEKALECVESSFVVQAKGAINHPRRRIFLPHVSLHYMAAALPHDGWLGMKIYTVSREKLRFIVLLYESERGELLAMIEADHLGRIGAGRQARTQLQAVRRVRPVKSVRVFSRTVERCEAFCREMSKQLGIEVRPAESAEAAARFGEILITATTSSEPVLQGSWLQPGAHVNAIGANMPNRREVDDELLARATVIAVDSLEQAQMESGDLIQGFSDDAERWKQVVELQEIIAGNRLGRRSPNEITLFKSAGIALWDVAAASVIYKRALELRRGKEVTLSEEI